MKIPILDSGHGKMIGGKYQTLGKRSPNWHKGILYEGMFNSWIVNRLIEKLDRKSIPYYYVSPEYKDTTLQTRVNRINKIYQQNPNTYLLSIHANAGGGKGIEGFTTPGITEADSIAEAFLYDLEKAALNSMRMETWDGDRDKEQRFYILRKTDCPAFLLECGFMDELSDYELLWEESYANQLAAVLANTIENLYQDELPV